MEAIKIDLNDYVVSGEGANGSSYDNIHDNTVMVKLYNPGYDVSTILVEHELSKKVYEIGVPSPEPGDLVTDGERIGIRFRRIMGKRSYSRAFSQEPERVPELAKEFARHCKQLHSTECPEGMFPDAKEVFLKLLDAEQVLDAGQKAAVRRFIIETVPDCRTALHGDMHFGNALTTLPQGAPLSEPHKFYFIDLGYFGYGFPLMDLGMTYNICKLADEAFILHDMHFGRETAEIAWKAFSEEYFFGPEKLGEKYFGPGVTDEIIDEKMKPYCLLKLLLVEYNVGFMPENYITFTKEVADSLK